MYVVTTSVLVVQKHPFLMALSKCIEVHLQPSTALLQGKVYLINISGESSLT
jgi:hypothetical protein